MEEMDAETRRQYLAEFDMQHLLATMHFLSALKQTSSVADLQEEFEDLIQGVTGLSDPLQISYFISALRPEIQREMLRLRRPSTLKETIALAQACEARMEKTTQNHRAMIFPNHSLRPAIHDSNSSISPLPPSLPPPERSTHSSLPTPIASSIHQYTLNLPTPSLKPPIIDSTTTVPTTTTFHPPDLISISHPLPDPPYPQTYRPPVQPSPDPPPDNRDRGLAEPRILGESVSVWKSGDTKGTSKVRSSSGHERQHRRRRRKGQLAHNSGGGDVEKPEAVVVSSRTGTLSQPSRALIGIVRAIASGSFSECRIGIQEDVGYCHVDLGTNDFPSSSRADPLNDLRLISNNDIELSRGRMNPDSDLIVKRNDETGPEPDPNPKEIVKVLTNAQEGRTNRSSRIPSSLILNVKRGPTNLFKWRYDSMDCYVNVRRVDKYGCNVMILGKAPHPFPIGVEAVKNRRHCVMTAKRKKEATNGFFEGIEMQGIETVVVTSNIQQSGWMRMKKIGDAREVFDEKPHEKFVSFSTINCGLTSHGIYRESLMLFLVLQRSGEVMKYKFESKDFEGTALLEAYVKCENVTDSHTVFAKRNISLVSCHGLIFAIGLNDLFEESLLLFKQMRAIGVVLNSISMLIISCSCMGYGMDMLIRMRRLDNFIPESVIWVGAITACSETSSFQACKPFQACGLSLDLVNTTQNNLVAVYRKCKHTDFAFKVFWEIVYLNLKSWHVVITSQGKAKEALSCCIRFLEFNSQQMWACSVVSNSISLLKSSHNCIGYGSLERCKRGLPHMMKAGLSSQDPVMNVVLEMCWRHGIGEIGIKFDYVKDLIIVTDQLESAILVIYGVAVMSVRELLDFELDPSISNEVVDEYLEVQQNILDRSESKVQDDEILPTVYVQKLYHGKTCEDDLAKAVKPLHKAEMALLIAKPPYAFGEKGQPAAASGGVDDVLPNAKLHMVLELVSWKADTEIGNAKKILKRVFDARQAQGGGLVVCHEAFEDLMDKFATRRRRSTSSECSPEDWSSLAEYLKNMITGAAQLFDANFAVAVPRTADIMDMFLIKQDQTDKEVLLRLVELEILIHWLGRPPEDTT